MLNDLIEVSIFLILIVGSTVNLARDSQQCMGKDHYSGQLKPDGTSIQNIDSEYFMFFSVFATTKWLTFLQLFFYNLDFSKLTKRTTEWSFSVKTLIIVS